MNDPRVDRMAQVLVHHSTRIQPGDRVLIEAEPPAEALVRALFREILLAGGHPHTFVSLAGQTTMTGVDDVFLQYANEAQLAYPATFYDLVYEQFESRIRIHSVSNSKLLMGTDKAKLARREKVTGAVTADPVPARRHEGVQVGHHALPDPGLCPGFGHEPGRFRAVRLRRLPRPGSAGGTRSPTGPDCKPPRNATSSIWPGRS